MTQGYEGVKLDHETGGVRMFMFMKSRMCLKQGDARF